MIQKKSTKEKNVKFGWWSVELPSNWTYRQDKECVAFYAEPTVGVLQISAHRKPRGRVTNDDIKEFTQEHIDAGGKLIKIKLEHMEGFWVQYISNDIYSKELWLRDHGIILFVTYNVEAISKHKETKAISHILNSLKVEDKKD